VRPHGAFELAQPEPGLFIAGIKSYGRAPTFLLATGYEQARSIAAYMAGDIEGAQRVELNLPWTGVCSSNLAPAGGETCCAADPDGRTPGGGVGRVLQHGITRGGRAGRAALMDAAPAEAASSVDPALTRPRLVVIAAMGIGQIFAWGSSYYLPAVLAGPVSRATSWPEAWIIGALSLGLLTSGLASPRVGHLIERVGGRPVLAASAVLLAIGLVIQAIAPVLPVFHSRLGRGGARDGHRLVRSCVLNARSSLRRAGSERDYPAYPVWRLRQYRVLAAERVFR
jgi:hypothetical protein